MGTGKERSTTDRRKDKGATVNARLRRDRTNSTMHRLRVQAVPHYIIGGLAAGGTVAGWIGPAVTTPGTAGVTVAAAGAAGAWMWARRRGRQALLAGLGAACWCGWTTAAGISWDALAVLAVGGYAAALRYWRRHRLPDPPEITAPAPAQPDEMSPPRLWERHVACSGGPLPGTHLTGEEQLRTGLRYSLHLVPGRHTLAKTLGVVGELRTGLRLRQDMDLVIEPDPEADEATVTLTIVQRSPVLTHRVLWPGGTYVPDTGMVAIGPYVDGEGLAHWRLHTPDSLWGGFIAGSIGSGKSRTMEAIALGLAEAGCAIWYADGQDGSSSPFLAEHTDWFRHGTTGIRDMLQAAQRIKRLRQVQNRMNRWSGWRPDQGRPGLVIIIDECHVPMADPQCQAIATELAREGRKVGISLIMASQVATLDAFGGGAGADALRSSVCAGNMLIMRSLTRTTKNVLPGVDVDPTTFPDVPGYAWLIDHSKARRSAPLRAFFLADEVMAASAQAVQWSAVEPAAAGAAGQLYGRRHQEVDTEAELAALFAELSGGAMLTSSTTAPAALAAIPVPRFPSPPEIRLHGPAPTRAAVLDRPVATAPPVAAPTAVEAVAGLLAAGVTAPGEIQARSGYGETAVRQALRELAQQGRARRVRHGVWEPTPTT